MSLRCGIIGLPNVGKSTLFNGLSKGKAASGNFPFCTIDPNVGIVKVPDSRLVKLSEIVNPASVVHATVSFVDIAGLVAGASQGEGLGNQFLAHIREVDALVHVVRCFDDDDIIHVAGGVNPIFDKEVIAQELQIADLVTLEKRKNKVGKLAKSGNKEALEENHLLDLFIASLEGGQDGRLVDVDEKGKKIVDTWHLLTCKPLLYVANIDEATLMGKQNPHLEALKGVVEKENSRLIPLCISVASEIAFLDHADQKEYLHSYGLKERSLDTLIRAGYELLNLITFFTAGPKEVRAWTIPTGTCAPAAAGVIHSDFEHGFIKAEVIKLQDYVAYGSEEGCKQAGKVGLQGKEYEVVDGDIIHFKCRK